MVLDLLGNWLLLVTGGEPSPEKPTVTLAPPGDSDHVSSQLIFRVDDCQGTYDMLSALPAQAAVCGRCAGYLMVTPRIQILVTVYF